MMYVLVCKRGVFLCRPVTDGDADRAPFFLLCRTVGVPDQAMSQTPRLDNALSKNTSYSF